MGNNNVNEHSSRSHLVLQVNVSSTDVASGYVQHGKLNLIDLAGSERIKVRSNINDFRKSCTLTCVAMSNECSLLRQFQA